MEVEEEMGEPVGTVGMEPIAYAAKEGRATEVEVATVAGEGMEATGERVAMGEMAAMGEIFSSPIPTGMTHRKFRL